MENKDVNELLESNQAVGVWLRRIPRVSATLYEIDSAAWEIFEPARKHITESMAWLEFEDRLDLATSTVSDSIAVLDRALPKAASQWRTAALVARGVLGDSMLRKLVGGNEPNSGP